MALHIVCNRRSRHLFSRQKAIGSTEQLIEHSANVRSAFATTRLRSEDNQQSITYIRSVKNGLNIRYYFGRQLESRSTDYCRLRAKAEDPYLWLLSCKLFTYYNIISRLCKSQCIIKNGLLVLLILVLKSTNNVD